MESAQQERFTQYLERVAGGVLDDGGVEAMVKAMEDLADASSDRAPIGGPAGSARAAGHPGLLKASAHLKVSSGGAVVYDRPGAPRQTDVDTTPGSEARRGGRR